MSKVEKYGAKEMEREKSPRPFFKRERWRSFHREWISPIKRFLKTVKNKKYQVKLTLSAVWHSSRLRDVLYRSMMYALTGFTLFYTVTHITFNETSVTNYIAYVFAILLFEHYFDRTVDKIRGN